MRPRPIAGREPAEQHERCPLHAHRRSMLRCPWPAGARPSCGGLSACDVDGAEGPLLDDKVLHAWREKLPWDIRDALVPSLQVEPLMFGGAYIASATVTTSDHAPVKPG